MPQENAAKLLANCKMVLLFHAALNSVSINAFNDFLGSELRSALTDFLNKENSTLVLQALSLRIYHLLRLEIRNGNFATQGIDMKLLLDGMVSLFDFL